MIEATNDKTFMSFYGDDSLDNVVEALELARAQARFVEWMESPPGLLMAQLTKRKLVKGSDSLMFAMAKAQTLSVYYREHSQNCDEVISRWNGENS